MHELTDDGRLDLYVYNEATAWTLSSRRLIEEGPLGEEGPWDEGVDDGRLIAQSLMQDDEFHVRLVLGELTPREQASWVGRARWWLRVPDGVLVVAAGGAWSWGWVEEPEDDEFVHLVSVPPGDYEVDVLTTFTGVNGLWTLQKQGFDEDPAAFWRRTRPNEPMPDWLKLWILDGAAEDPGHEDEWEWAFERYERLSERVQAEPNVDWIVRLRPLAAKPPRPPTDDGMFEEPERRVPDRFPDAVAAAPVNTEGPDEPHAFEPADVLERVEDLGPVPVAGGPVELAARDAHVAVRLAWFANGGVDVELLVEGDELGYWVEQHLPPGDTEVRTADDGRLRISFAPSRLTHGAEAHVRQIDTGIAALPMGADLEMVTAAPAEETQGRVRLRGPVVAGVWRIEHAVPAVDAGTLRAALDLAGDADGTAAEFAARFGDTWECVESDPFEDFLDVDDDGSFEVDEWPTGDAVHVDPDSGRRYLMVGHEDLPLGVQAATEPALLAFEELGAVRVGDTVCDASPNILIRAVAEQQARWYGVLMVAPYLEPVTEVYTSFEDGTSLTTTTNPFGGLGGPDKGIFRSPHPADTNVTDLVALHLEAVAVHAAARDTQVVLIRQNLVGMAIALEEFLARQFAPE